MFKIIKCKREDMDPYIRINTKSWNESYKGIVFDEFLEKITNEVEENVERAKHRYNEMDHKYLLIYNDKPVGMGSCGYSRIDKYPNSGELYSIYLLDEVKGKGLGKELFNYLVNVLKETGYNDMVIGCLKDNERANNFYKHMGGELVFTRTLTIGNQELEENIYYFNKI